MPNRNSDTQPRTLRCACAGIDEWSREAAIKDAPRHACEAKNDTPHGEILMKESSRRWIALAFGTAILLGTQPAASAAEFSFKVAHTNAPGRSRIRGCCNSRDGSRS